MRKFLVFTTCLIFLLLSVSNQARGIYIVDTGQPDNSRPFDLSSEEYLAVQFSLDMGSTVTDIEGWIGCRNAGTLEIAIYGDAENTVDTKNELFRQGFSVPLVGVFGWYGLSGLDWYLPAGKYWVAFEVREGNTFAGTMSGDSPNPLPLDAFWSITNSEDVVYITNSLEGFENLNLGIKIQQADSVLKPVAIDIKPFSWRNLINRWGWGFIPVAVLSNGDFDATSEVDRTSLTFGMTGNEDSFVRCLRCGIDVDRNGYEDLFCFFRNGQAGFQCGDEEGFLKGELVDGTLIEGSDSVNIWPCR